MAEYTKEQIQAWKEHAIDHCGEGLNEMTPLMRVAATLAQRVEILANMVLSQRTPHLEERDREAMNVLRAIQVGEVVHILRTRENEWMISTLFNGGGHMSLRRNDPADAILSITRK